MGRNRTTNADKLLNGTAQPCRMRNVPSGEVLTKLPEPATAMNDVSIWYYNEIGGNLVSMGVLESQDLIGLEDLAYMWGRYWEYESKRIATEEKYNKKMEEYNNDPSDVNGKFVDRLMRELKHYEATKNKAKTLITKQMGKYGLSPVERQKLEVKGKIGKEDPIAKLIMG